MLSHQSKHLTYAVASGYHPSSTDSDMRSPYQSAWTNRKRLMEYPTLATGLTSLISHVNYHYLIMDNNRLYVITDDDIDYIVDMIDIEDNLGRVTLDKGDFKVTITAHFEELGYWTTGGYYPGYPPERIWEHVNWNTPTNIKATATNGYEIEQESFEKMKKWLEHINTWE